MSYDIIIVGSGPAGYTSGIYAGRANTKCLLLQGPIQGGQLTTTTEIENFTGFESIGGYEFMQKIKDQAIKNNCEIKDETALEINKNKDHFEIKTDKETYLSKTVILAMGASANKLEFENSDKYWNKGISACAVCDGALPMFRKKQLVVIGGGDTAMEEAMFLSRFASKVIILVRSDKLRASKTMQKRVLDNKKIEIRFRHNIIKVDGDDELLKQITVRDSTFNVEYSFDIAGLFYAIGHTPNTDIVGHLVELKDNKYIKKQDESTRTNVNGIFAAGDIMDDHYRQAITAAGSGCMASLDAIHYLESL